MDSAKPESTRRHSAPLDNQGADRKLMENVIPIFIYPRVKKKKKTQNPTFLKDSIGSGEMAQWVNALEQSTVEGEK
jgi:hypothetical protein